MSALIDITRQAINGEEVNAVNAREVWEFVESKQEFANWIKARLSELGAVEGVDFLIILSKTQGRPQTQYIVTLDIAKHLAMMERNEKGKECRQHFIDFEKAQTRQPVLPQNYKAALVELIAKVEEIESLNAKIEADKPKVALANCIEVAGGSVNISDWVRVLKDENTNIKQARVFELLKEWKIIFSDNGVNKPYAKYLEKGWFEVTENSIVTPKGNKTRLHTKITGKGQVALSYRIKEYFDEKQSA